MKGKYFSFAICCVAVCGLLLGMTPVKASVEINDYTINATDAALADGTAAGDLAALGIVDILHVDQWKTLSRSYIGFHDLDGSGGISAGDTFDDYVLIRVDQFIDVNSNDITPATYGAAPGDTFGLTAILKMSGVQVTNNVFSINTIAQFDLFFDSATAVDGTGYTKADFTSLASFIDGTLVEDFEDLIAGGGVNSGPTIPDGQIGLIVSLDDKLAEIDQAYDDFEKDFFDDLGNQHFPQLGFLLGISDSNNNAKNNLTPTVDELGTHFGFDPGTLSSPPDGLYLGGDYSFGFGTESDGSFNKEIVPEPTSVLAWFGALAFAGFFGLRRRIC